MKPLLFPSFLALAVPLSLTVAGQSCRADVRVPQGLYAKDLSRHNKYRVAQVLGGDRLTIWWKGQIVRMGLLGVDAKRPEATKFLKEQLDGQMVCLDYGPEIQRNERGWPVAYFYRAFDGALVNQAVLAGGFGLVADHKGRHCDLLHATADAAQFNAEGLWKDGLITRTTVEPSEEAREAWAVTSRHRKEARARLLIYHEMQDRKAMEWTRLMIEAQKWATIQEVIRRGGSVRMQWTEQQPRDGVPNF
jgi:hypothetical protein